MRAFGITIDFRLVFLDKKLISNAIILWGNDICVRAVQPSNTLISPLVILLESVMLFRLVQFLNADHESSVTLSGITILSISHPSKADIPIEVTLS